jgi:hypothetical protein
MSERFFISYFPLHPSFPSDDFITFNENEDAQEEDLGFAATLPNSTVYPPSYSKYTL